MSILNNLNQRTNNQKKVFSLVLALIITLFIVGFWVSFTNNSAADQSTGNSTDKLSSVSPWQVVKDDFSNAFSGLNGSTSSPQVSSSPIPVEVVSDNLATSTGTSIDEIIATTSTSTVKN